MESVMFVWYWGGEGQFLFGQVCCHETSGMNCNESVWLVPGTGDDE